MNILIIGCGYVGKAMAKHWKSKGHHIAVTTRKEERIAELESLADEVLLIDEGLTSSHLLHRDSILLCVAADSLESYSETYLGTAKFLIEHSKLIKQIIYTSSTSVYGDHGGEWIDEMTPVTPSSPQAKILCETEDTLLEHNNVCIFRLGQIYGPGRELANFLRRLGDRPLPGKGEGYTNLTQLKTIITAIDDAMEHNLKGIYNLCEDLHIPRKAFYEKICEEEGLPKVKWDPSKNSIHQGNKRVSSKKFHSIKIH